MVDNVVNPSVAANIYQQNSNFAKGISNGDKSGEDSFADVMKTQTRKAIDTIREGEQKSAQAVTGEANIVDVVQAVNKAEMTLQTVMALRDRVVKAYQEIISMPI